MLRIFALTISGNLFHWTSKGWELYQGKPHERPMEFNDAGEGREYLRCSKMQWPAETIDRYIADPETNSFCGTHEIEPFEGFNKI